MAENLTQKTAQELAVLQNNLLSSLLSGELPFDHLEWFISLTENQRLRLLSVASLITDEVSKEHIDWFLSQSYEKKNQLLIIMPTMKGEDFTEASKDEAQVEVDVSDVVEKEESIEVMAPPEVRHIIAKDTDVLKLISGHEKLIVNAFDFKETKKDGTDIFEALFFDDCKHLKSNRTPDPPKSKLAVLVYEVCLDATFMEMFGSIGVGLTRLCFTMEQIRNYCLKHSAWMSHNGFPTFFLFRDEGKYYVARVLIDDEDGEIKIIEEPLSCDTIWPASKYRRVVVPDLNNQEF